MDSFNRRHNYLRISLTERCNLRCLYCMPEQGIDLAPDGDLLTSPELIRLVHLFASMGVSKLRLTGGEPLVRKDVEELCGEMRATPGVNTLGITTNGILLPRKIERLHQAGVNALNLSLDTLDQSKFIMITRRNGLSKVLDSIKLAECLGYSPVKINCVVMRGVNEDEIGDFVALTKDRDIEVRFIEFMPFDDNKWSRGKMVPFMEMMDRAEASVAQGPSTSASSSNPDVRVESSETNGIPSSAPSQPDRPPTAQKWFRRPHKLIPVQGGETASLFRFEGYRGRLGFITSMTSNFCATCNRLRLTADGNLKVCLFGEDELSLRDLMRQGATDDELEVAIRKAVFGKHEKHGGKESPEALAASSNRPMIKIGG